MSARIAAYVEQHSQMIEQALYAALPVSTLAGTDRFNEALRYAVSGGKRMRPILALLAAGVCGVSPEKALAPAAAVEFLHAASLVFDDLPAMDDAQIRRGRPAVHAAFGEDIALLVALALFNEAYALVASFPGLLSTAVREIGSRGMIGGQAADLIGKQARSRLEKTSALMRLTMAAGAAAGHAKESDAQVLASFGQALGEAYQICDDMVDLLANSAAAGKTTHQDERHSRMNLATELGYTRSCNRVRQLAEAAVARLRAHFGDSIHVQLLGDFAQGIVESGRNVSL